MIYLNYIPPVMAVNERASGAAARYAYLARFTYSSNGPEMRMISRTG